MNLWEQVKVKWEGIHRRRNLRDKEEDEEKVKANLRSIVLEKLTIGKVFKAANFLESKGVADISNLKTKNKLKNKFPQRSREIPKEVAKGICR